MATSRTAEYVALCRALETTETRREPLFRDPFAAHLLTDSRARALRLANVPGMRGMLERYADWRAPGARTSAIGRTRFIDDVVRAEAARGMRQVVILGAGYDSRAHRIDELKSVRVFEVDRADTQAEKRRRIEKIAGARKDVRYVAVDFEKQDLATQLADAGWRADRTSLFIWEGVTNYLDAAAVAVVLDMIGRTAAGSVIVFTYIHRGVNTGGDEKFRRELGTIPANVLVVEVGTAYKTIAHWSPNLREDVNEPRSAYSLPRRQDWAPALAQDAQLP